ncbi:hypothetical protein ACVIGA_000599 [Bradyrhizobium sp. USDA 3240]
MQHTNDGTHVILPATVHLRMPTDRAGLPVMWLRHADGKMRRDGVRAALLQRSLAVDERGRLHGASGLMTIAALRVMAWIKQACRRKERKREWLRSERRDARLRRRDKRGSPVEPQAIGMAWVLACRLVESVPCKEVSSIRSTILSALLDCGRTALGNSTRPRAGSALRAIAQATVDAASPPRRGGQFERSRGAEIDLVGVTRIGPPRVEGVVDIANAEADAHLLETLPPQVPARDIDEREEIAGGARLAAAMKPERDLSFQFLALQTLYDRYFLHIRGNSIELPQAFFMRVAMGLALREIDREGRAIEFYNLLSSFDFMASTPTAASAKARSAPISRLGTSTSRSSSICARTPATTAAAPTT